MKTGKEIKTSKFKNYNVTFGSVNNKNPKAIYINISSWLEPKDESILNYNLSIRGINKKVKQTLFNHFNSLDSGLFDYSRTIVDLDIRESGVKYGKRSFMSCETTLYLNIEHSITSEYMKETLEKITELLISEVFETDKTFKFNKKKK